MNRGEERDPIEEALRAANWALQQASEDLLNFELGRRRKRSVSTSSSISSALIKIETALTSGEGMKR